MRFRPICRSRWLRTSKHTAIIVTAGNSTWWNFRTCIYPHHSCLQTPVQSPGIWSPRDTDTPYTLEVPAWGTRLMVLRPLNYTLTDRGKAISAMGSVDAQQNKGELNPMFLSPGERLCITEQGTSGTFPISSPELGLSNGPFPRTGGTVPWSDGTST